MSRPLLLLRPLGRCLTRCTRRDRVDSLCIRNKTTDSGFSQRASLNRSKTQGSSRGLLRNPIRNAPSRPQPNFSKAHARPQQVVIYHAGSGKIAFIGMMRLSTILIFVVSCTVVAPAFYAAEYPWYIPPAIIAAGAFPMLFVSYTAAPFVNLVYLALPAFAQQSREHMLSYLQNVPRTATLSIETMKFNFYPRRTQVAISDLAPGKSLTRPVSFINTNPQPQPWWRGKDGVHFYTPEANRPAKSTPKFFPEAWERVFAQIKQNSLLMKNK
ncbi:uncharacterized protein CIMG_08828 [Coccidioides immitis RS]|uniref:Uncharacterized protein n=1 Tax=Coccidioides immitis (strain RS) TaxID=246410 RepID=J3K6A5_COCIM|nr:uncharacterized protein CIMG_08828 [Coccidioides immitis RS]EAS30082.3 hypothetical protein CIMG_08828 [Coccidioides immitis RS]